jgi:hypothetical protein
VIAADSYLVSDFKCKLLNTPVELCVQACGSADPGACRVCAAQRGVHRIHGSKLKCSATLLPQNFFLMSLLLPLTRSLTSCASC